MTDATADNSALRDMRIATITRNNVLWAMGAGLIPIPVVDYLGVMGVQLKALNELATEYKVSFNENLVKNLVAALISGLGTHGLKSIFASVAKFIPVIGSLVGGLSFSLGAGAITYAIIKTFIVHFESGGTFLDFNPQKVRDAFQSNLQAGADYAQTVQAEQQGAVA